MQRRAWRPPLLVAALVLVGAAGLWRVSRGGAPGAGPAPRGAGAPSPSGRSVVLLATVARAASSTALVVPLDAPDQARAVGSIEHLPEGGVRGALSPDGATLYAIVDRAPGDYGGALVALPLGGGPARALADGIAHASRPVPTDGAVLVSRGVAGEARPEERRVDALEVTAVDPASGARSTRFAAPGWELHLAAAAGDEAIVLWKAGGRGQLLAVGADGARRLLADDVGLTARDFSVAGGVLYFANSEPGRATVERVELATATRTRVLDAAAGPLAPLALPTGGFLWNLDGLHGPGALPAIGPGVVVARAVTRDGAWVAAWHYAPSPPAEAREPDVVVFAPGSDAPPVRLAPPAGTRYEIAGVR